MIRSHGMEIPLVDLKAQYRTIKTEIRQAIDEVLEAQQFILGTNVAELESEVANITGTKFGVACASGTDALLLSLICIGIQPGDEVITTAFSFFATAGMIAWIGATPVFVDVNPDTYLMADELVISKLTKRTKAILGVHLFGQCCRMERLASLGMPVIEDAAQAIGAMRKGRPAGSLGLAGCFSFFPTKNAGGYGDGGMITTDDDALANRIRKVRTHGEGHYKYIHESLGTNSRLDEIQAAVLRVKLRHLEEWNQKRRKNAEFYLKALQDLPLQLPIVDDGNTSNYHQFVIQTDRRDQLKDFLASRGVTTAIYYPRALPLQPCFEYLGNKTGDFPAAEKSAAHSLALPVYPELTDPQLEFVATTIRSFY